MPELESSYPSWMEPKSLTLIEGAGHFFEGRHPELANATQALEFRAVDQVEQETVESAVGAEGDHIMHRIPNDFLGHVIFGRAGATGVLVRRWTIDMVRRLPPVH